MSTDKQQLSELVVRLQQGDGKAFEEIYNLTRESAYFTALKISKNEDDAEDILQEAYVHMLDKIKTLDNPDVFKSWFNQIVANKAKDLLRKNHPERFTDAYFKTEKGEEKAKFDFIEDTDEAIIPDAVAENTELCREVMKMIDSLSDDKRTAVILYYYDNMTTREIAESLGVNENTVKSRLVQAKKDLAKSFTEYEKKHGKLLGVAPMPLVVWSLKTAAAGAASASAASGAAAATLAAVTAGSAAGTAAAGTGAAVGSGIITKIIAGIVAAAIVGGGAAAGTKAIRSRKNERQQGENVSASADAGKDDSGAEGKSGVSLTALPPDKAVDTVQEKGELKYGVSYRQENYVRRDRDGNLVVEKGRMVPDYSKFSATYNDLLPAARENSAKYSSESAGVISSVNSLRAASGKPGLKTNSTLTEQAGVRAEEIAYSQKNSDTRPDGSSYTAVFDRNGFTSGTRYECRVYRQKSASDAVKVLTSKYADRLKNDNITDIGVGVSKTPDTDEYVFVIHLYSASGEGENTAGAADKAKEGAVEQLIDANGRIADAQDSVDEFNENVQDIPVIGDIFSYDFHNDWIFEAANGILDRIEGREPESEAVEES